MKKEDFVKVLEILKDTDIIDRYDFLIEENAIKITNIIEEYYDSYDYTYYFDEDNNLIHPQIIDTKKRIKQLEQEKQECEETLKKLLTIYN